MGTGRSLAELVRTKSDWDATALGDASTWPQSLKTALSIALSSRFPMVIFWGEQLSLLYNDAYAAILRDKHPAALGAPARVAWAEIWDFIAPMLRRVLDGEATWSEDQHLAMDRRGFLEEAYFTWSYSPILDERGKVGGVFTAVQEMTARVLSERRLAVLRALGEQIAEAKTVNAACDNAVGTFAKATHDVPFAAIYILDGERFRRAAATGMNDETAPPWVEHGDPWCMAEVARSGVARRVDRSDVTLPGGPWPEAAPGAFVLPIAKPGEHTAYGVLVAGRSPRLAFDEPYESFLKLASQHLASAIANAVAYEEERRRAEALAELDRAKTAFFSNVSHEFRTPLTLMLAPIEDMRASDLDEGERERVELLHRNAVRLLKLVNNLLDFSRIEAGRVEAVYEPTDLSELTAELASTFRSAIERAGLSLVVDCAALGEPAYVDRTMWEKIVLNLLSNAFKFTFEGSIRVRLARVDGSIELEVTDTGIGIAQAELPRVFERFHRIEGARSRSHEGSGIGLALVSELVRMHGGEITARSELGAGTTFRVRIPRGADHLPAERVRGERSLQSTAVSALAYVEEVSRWSAPPESTPAIGAKHAARIVVADDNADMRDYVTRLLAEHWTVEAVSDGAAALEAIRREPTDLVLADVMMPILDGFGLLRAVRSDPALEGIPVVLLSARAGEEAVTEGLEAGADDYLTKPFTARELLVRITARLAATKTAHQLSEQRTQLYRAFTQAPFPVVVLRGPTHVIEAVNEACMNVWGKDASIIGKALLEVLPELRDQRFPTLLDEVLRTGVSHHGSGERAQIATGPDGALRDVYFNYVYSPLFDSSDQVDGVMVTAFDVTEQVVASRAKDEFLATMSHELRTPLNAMLGWASMLGTDFGDPARLRQGLSAIERNARAQARLVDDLLDVARIITGKLNLALEPTELSSPIFSAADAVRPAADARRVRLVLDLDPEVGATMADPARLQQIVWNLLSNAVRFTPEQGRVTVTTHRSESSAIIRVVDTGMGIAREHLTQIFDRFRQVDSSMTRAHGGLGLGLAIVRYLVEAHGGKVEAASEGLGRGATFTVTLPLRPVDDAGVARYQPEPADASAATLANVRVLVVDDDRDSLQLLRVILEDAGAEVTTASRASEALAASGPFDVIVSDIGMPEMDGYSLIREIRAHGGATSVPAIALTAYARTEDANAALRAGYQEHFAKPVDAPALVAAIKSWSALGAS